MLGRLIHAYKLKVDNIDGTISNKYLNTLNYFCARKIIDGDNSEILNTPSLEIAKTISNGYDDLDVLGVEMLSTANIIRNDDSEVGISLVENVFQDNLPFDDVLISTPKISGNVQGELDPFEGSMIVSENVLSSGEIDEETGCKNDCIDFHRERECYAYVDYSVNQEDEDVVIVSEKDVCNVDKEDGGIAMEIYPEKFEEIPGKEGSNVSHSLLEILGADELIDEYHKGEIKFDKYPGEKMYESMYQNTTARLQVKLIVAKMNFEEQIRDLQIKKMAKNYISIDMISSKGSNEIKFDSLIRKLYKDVRRSLQFICKTFHDKKFGIIEELATIHDNIIIVVVKSLHSEGTCRHNKKK